MCATRMGLTYASQRVVGGAWETSFIEDFANSPHTDKARMVIMGIVCHSRHTRENYPGWILTQCRSVEVCEKLQLTETCSSEMVVLALAKSNLVCITAAARTA